MKLRLPLDCVVLVPFGTLALLCAVLSCSGSASVGPHGAKNPDPSRPVQITHEPCEVGAKDAVKTDVNNDGRADIVRVMKTGREVCRALDLNFDGRFDSFLYYDDSGALRRRESLFDRDKIIDEIGLYQHGQLVEKQRETNLDNKLDTWDFYQGERLVRRERDTNGDGRIDQWWAFSDPQNPDCATVQSDINNDGRPDISQNQCQEAASSGSSPAPENSVSPAASSPPVQDAGAPPVASAQPAASARPASSAQQPQDAGAKR